MHNAKQVSSMKYAFVTNRAQRAIASLRAGRTVAHDASESLELAAGLLLEMRRGAAFVLDSQEQLGYSAESIPAATRALGIIKRLSLASQVPEVHTLLETLERNLRDLAGGRSVTDTELDRLELFVGALNQSLTEEVSQASLGSALEQSGQVGG